MCMSTPARSERAEIYLASRRLYTSHLSTARNGLTDRLPTVALHCCMSLHPSIHPHAIDRLGCPLSAAAKNLAVRERRWKWKVHTCTPLGEAYHCLDCYCLSSSSSNLSTNSISGRSTAGVCRLRLAQLYCSIRSRARHERRLADRMKMADCTPSHWSILFLRLFTANRKRSTPWGARIYKM
jgi:hypothetical protein